METNIRPNTFLTLDIYQTDDLRKWIGIYLHACRSRNLAGGTIEFYGKKLNAFVQFCLKYEITNINQINAEYIRQFLIILEESGHRPAGVHCYYRSIKTFLKWYEREAEPADWRNPINKVKAPIVPLEPLDPVSIETIKAMLGTCKRGQLSDARDKASLLVLLDTGMRLAEFLALNVDDVDPITGMILIRSGKGRKPRNVYLGDRSRQVLRRYVKERRDYNPALWVSRSGERLTETGLRMMLRRRAAQAGVPVPSPHDFRRAFAIERWRAGVDILTLSKLMGHTSLQVLNRYLKQIGEDLEQAAKQSSPVDRNF
ncbi:MAG: tyrosine-type recombinase/integrase [Chloroflexi bacterium]|nr:tyrosine-type recombinase/integrase [Chloroflexota bacterium]